LQHEFEIDIRWTAFPLHPDTPGKGLTLEELFAGRNIDIPQMLNHLKDVANGLGLPFGDREMTYNSRLAQELGKWAESKGKGDAFHHAVFRAYFVNGENIAEVPVLVRAAESVNLIREDALAILQGRPYKDAVDSDWQRSYELKVTAVPTVVCDHQTLVGAQPYQILEKLLLSSNVKRRNPS